MEYDNVHLKLSKIVAVLRSYNNSAVIRQIKNLRSFIPYVIVVTNTTKDNELTSGLISELNDPNVQLVKMGDEYSWSSALNRALEEIDSINLQNDNKFEYVFNVSVEALFEERHLVAMLKEFRSSVGIVGTSFMGIKYGKEITLGASYKYPRNTGMLIYLPAFAGELHEIRKFDLFCDGIGGMEDVDFVLRASKDGGIEASVVDLKVPLILGIHYDQEEKEKRENKSLEAIFARY